MASLEPLDAQLPDEQTLEITWADGVKTQYPLDFLRSQCPCAECVDEWTGEVRVNQAMFPGMTLKSLDEAGSYAFRITFGDNHSTGLFTFKRLREELSPES